MMRFFTIRNGLVNKLFVVITCSVALLFYEIFVYSASISFDYHFHSGKLSSETVMSSLSSQKNLDLYYKSRQSWTTSNLGSIIFKNTPRETFRNIVRENRSFLILMWEHWGWLQARHAHSFSNLRESDPLGNCSVNNCIITGNNSFLDTADAVVIHIQKGLFPVTKNRKKEQRWIFLNDESPFNAFSMTSKRPKLTSLANVFNWSMTYRSDADIPVPYGRTVPLPEPLVSTVPKIPYWESKQRDTLAAILISNCAVSYRMKYLNELKRYIQVDVHGKCSDTHKTSCPGHFKSDCKLMSKYLFYLVFENSKCKEYLTEKSFNHAYGKGAIPVILGPSKDDCDKLLPPNSFLHVENFKTPLDLANEMIDIRDNLEKLLFYHQWRNHFEVVNEHGYFGSKSLHLCRVCEALNFNDEEEKIYSENDLKKFLDPSISCF